MAGQATMRSRTPPGEERALAGLALTQGRYDPGIYPRAAKQTWADTDKSKQARCAVGSRATENICSSDMSLQQGRAETGAGRCLYGSRRLGEGRDEHAASPTHIGTLPSLVCPVSGFSCWVYAARVSLGLMVAQLQGPGRATAWAMRKARGGIF